MRWAIPAVLAIVIIASYTVAWEPEVDLDDFDGSRIMDVAFSPNGSVLATGDSTGTIETWEIDSFATNHEFVAHSGYTRVLEYSPNGTMLASAGDSGEVKIWDAVTFQLIQDISVPGTSIRALEFSSDSSMIAFGNYSGDIYIKSTSDWATIDTPTPLGSAIRGISWTPDDTMLYVAAMAGTVHILDTTTWAQAGTVVTNNGTIKSMDISPDGEWLATGHSDSTLRIHSLNGSGDVYNHTIHEAEVSALKFSPNSSLLVSTSYGTYPIYSTDLSDFMNPVPLTADPTVCNPTGIDFSPSGHRLAVPLCDMVSIQVMNSDGDGLTDPYDDCPYDWGNSTINVTGCVDNDGDGYDNGSDAFPDDPTEWNDTDGDGIGDSADFCPTVYGNSTEDVMGCPDTDGDGWYDSNDSFPQDPSEWNDTDGDGFGDNSDGCPLEHGPVNGCPEPPNNDTNGTNNNTNQTGNETNGTGNETNQTGNETDPGNGTGGNETGNETDNNQTGTNGTNNQTGGEGNGTGSNDTDGNDTGTGTGPGEVPDDEQNSSSDENGSLTADGEAATTDIVMFSGLAAGILLGGTAGGLLVRRKITPTAADEIALDFGEHPTLVMDELPEMDG